MGSKPFLTLLSRIWAVDRLTKAIVQQPAPKRKGVGHKNFTKFKGPGQIGKG